MSKKYSQKFRKEWFQEKLLKDWIMAVPGDDNKARCKFCMSQMKAKFQDLKSHAQSKKHRSASPRQNSILPQEMKEDENKTTNIIYSDSTENEEFVDTQCSSAPLKDNINPNNSCCMCVSFDRNSKHSNKGNDYVSEGNSQIKEHELDLFAKSIAAQMKNLPEKQSVKLTLQIQNLVTQARLESIESQMENTSPEDQQIITVNNLNIGR